MYPLPRLAHFAGVEMVIERLMVIQEYLKKEIDVKKQSRDFSYNGFTINTKLLLKPRRWIADVLENYKRYWFDNFDDFANKIS